MRNDDQPTVLLIRQQFSDAPELLTDSPYQVIQRKATQLQEPALISDQPPDVILVEGKPDQRLLENLQIQYDQLPLVVVSHDLSEPEQQKLAELGVDDVIFDSNAQAINRRIFWQLQRSKRQRRKYSVDSKLADMTNIINYMQSQTHIGSILLTLREGFRLHKVILATLYTDYVDMQEFTGDHIQPFHIALGITEDDPLVQLLRRGHSKIISEPGDLLTNVLLAINRSSESALVIPFQSSEVHHALIFVRPAATPFIDEDIPLFELFTIHFKLLSQRNLNVFPVNRLLLPLWHAFVEASSAETLAGKLCDVLREHRKIRDAVISIAVHSKRVCLARTAEIEQAVLQLIDDDSFQSLVKQTGPELRPLIAWKTAAETRIEPKLYVLMATDCIVILPIRTGKTVIGLVLLALEQHQFPDETELIAIENQVFTAALAAERLQPTNPTAEVEEFRHQTGNALAPVQPIRSDKIDSLLSSRAPSEPAEDKSEVQVKSQKVQESAKSQPITIGQLQVHLQSRHVLLNGEPLELTRIEYELLSYLAINVNQVVNHEELLLRVWGPESRNARQYLWVNISRLRKKLNRSKRLHYIYNRPGIGYMLRAPAGS